MMRFAAFRTFRCIISYWYTSMSALRVARGTSGGIQFLPMCAQTCLVSRCWWSVWFEYVGCKCPVQLFGTLEIVGRTAVWTHRRIKRANIFLHLNDIALKYLSHVQPGPSLGRGGRPCPRASTLRYMKYFVYSFTFSAHEEKVTSRYKNGTELKKEGRVKFVDSRTSVCVQWILPHRAHLLRELI
jgi:hypothetical protein